MSKLYDELGKMDPVTLTVEFGFRDLVRGMVAIGDEEMREKYRLYALQDALIHVLKAVKGSLPDELKIKIVEYSLQDHKDPDEYDWLFARGKKEWGFELSEKEKATLKEWGEDVD